MTVVETVSLLEGFRFSTTGCCTNISKFGTGGGRRVRVEGRAALARREAVVKLPLDVVWAGSVEVAVS